MKKILLDTTYILPLLGVEIEIPNLREKIISLAKNFKPMLNSLSILEAKWKTLKFAKKEPSILESFSEGLLFLTRGEVFEIIPFYTYEADLIATTLYKYHKDYIDCSILASAYINADIFITEEKNKMQKLLEQIPPNYNTYRKTSTKLTINTINQL
ncbi:MAG: hypothetical protein ACTSXW_02860 [Candidatus Baldrarchaeia archaeon]